MLSIDRTKWFKYQFYSALFVICNRTFGIITLLVYCLLPPFFKILSNLLPCCPNCSFCCLVFLAGWVKLMCLLFIMDLHMLSLGNLVPEGPCCVFFMQQGDKFTEGLNLECCFFLVLSFGIIHTQTHTQRYTEQWGASRLTQPYKYILTQPVMYSQQLSVLHRMNKWLISKIHFPQCLFFSKITCL